MKATVKAKDCPPDKGAFLFKKRIAFFLDDQETDVRTWVDHAGKKEIIDARALFAEIELFNNTTFSVS